MPQTAAREPERSHPVRLRLTSLTGFWPAIALLSCLWAGQAAAIDVEFSSRPVRREVLALYDSRHEKTAAASRMHRLAELPLNWLGYKLVFADVNGALPSGEELNRFRGIVSWLIEPMADPRRYLDWLDAATAKGLKLACMAELAPNEPPGSEDIVARIFARLGLKPFDKYVNVTNKAKISTINLEMAGFERKIDKALPGFRVVEALSAAARVHLAASVPELEGVQTSVLISTSQAGGYVSDEFTIYYDSTTDKVRWIVNPFLFFKLALGEERFPIPDVTTLSGRRMYFSHVDGDGWNNISEIEGYREAQVSTADVIRREVIEPYPDLPVTIGLIAGDTVPDLGGMENARDSAKRIFALNNVEVASHTYTHPFSWSFYENYDRAAELALVESAAHPVLSFMDHVRGALYRVAGKPALAASSERLVAGSAELPRSYMKEPFNLEQEIKQAMAVSEQLAPPGKKAGILLWSGDTEAFEGALRLARIAGIRNMNGGDSRLDAEFPSLYYVPPISRPVGKERQINAVNSNENTYTNYWHGPYYGQFLLDQTLKNTETPRRLKAFNLYYHMYSGEKPASLAAIKHFTELARNSHVIPVKASDYVGIAESFFTTEIEQVDAATWAIRNRGNLQTLRFDDADGLNVDYAKSQGVIGANRHQGSLYVSLDPAVETATLTVQSLRASPPNGTNTVAHLVESRWQLRKYVAQDCGFRIEAQGFGAGDMVWNVAPSQIFDVTASTEGRQIYSSQWQADTNGRLTGAVAASAIEPIQLSYKCHER